MSLIIPPAIVTTINSYSKTPTISPIVALLESTIPQFSDTDPIWRQFVVDHKAVILQNSIQNNVSDEVLNICQYNINAYLRYIGVSTSINWIIFYINNISSDIEFFNVSAVMIPPMSFITNLYDLYQTTTAQQINTIG